MRNLHEDERGIMDGGAVLFFGVVVLALAAGGTAVPGLPAAAER